jgi:hypothetical protein
MPEKSVHIAECIELPAFPGAFFLQEGFTKDRNDDATATRERYIQNGNRVVRRSEGSSVLSSSVRSVFSNQ